MLTVKYKHTNKNIKTNLDPETHISICGRASAHGAMGRRIDPSWWTH